MGLKGRIKLEYNGKYAKDFIGTYRKEQKVEPQGQKIDPDH